MAPTEASTTSNSRTSKNGSKTTNEEQNAFAQHAAADSALKSSDQQQQQQSQSGGRGLTFLGRIAVFLLFPTVVGVLGLYFAWLEARRKPEKKHLSLDRDFVLPFLLALAFACVIGLQTGGFRAAQARPLIAWPKVRRVKKVVKKKKQNGNNKKEPIKEE